MAEEAIIANQPQRKLPKDPELRRRLMERLGEVIQTYRDQPGSTVEQSSKKLEYRKKLIVRLREVYKKMQDLPPSPKYRKMEKDLWWLTTPSIWGDCFVTAALRHLLVLSCLGALSIVIGIIFYFTRVNGPNELPTKSYVIAYSFIAGGIWTILWCLSGWYLVDRGVFFVLPWTSGYFSLNFLISISGAIFFFFYSIFGLMVEWNFTFRWWIPIAGFIISCLGIYYNVHAYRVMSRAHMDMQHDHNNSLRPTEPPQNNPPNPRQPIKNSRITNRRLTVVEEEHEV